MKSKILFFITFWTSFLSAKEINESIELEKLILIHSNKADKYFSDVPFSANALVLDELDEHGIRSVQDATSKIPNFNYMEFGTRSFHSILGVRGLTNTAFFSDPSVVLYVDDVPYGNTFSYSNNTFAVDRIETYRGPQGQMFGKNSYGGAFNVTTRKPNNKMKGYLSTEYGRFHRWITNGYISGGLIQDQLFFSLSGSHGQGDGYLKNTFLGNTPDDEQYLSGRASLIWKPTTSWDVSLIVNGDEFDDGTPRYVSIDSNPFEIQSNQNGKVKQAANTEAVRIQYQHENLQILSVTARRDWRADPVFVDADFTSDPLVTVSIDQRQTQWSQEFRLRSYDEDLDWLAGMFLSTGNYELKHTTTALNGTLLRSGEVKDNSIAIFVNANYHLSNTIRLHAGFRLEHVEKSLKQRHRLFNGQRTTLISDRNDFFLSPKIGLDYLFNDQLLLYISSGLAFKPGGYSTGSVAPGLEEFDREQLWASETGIKTKWFDNRAQLNLAFFYYKIKDYQIEKFLSFLDYSIINAPRATSYGMEAETTIEVMQHLQFETAFGYNRVRFDRYVDPVTGKDFSKKTPPYVPEFTFMLAAHYKHPEGYFARTEWRWIGTTYFDDANSEIFKRDAFSTFNARLGFEGKNFDIFVYGENLTNERYVTFILPGLNAQSPARPRTLGVKIKLNF